MRITFVLGSILISGGLRVIATHAKFLTDKGHKVKLVCAYGECRSFKQRAKSRLFLEGRPANQPLSSPYLDSLGLDYSVVDHSNPVKNGDVPDADLVIATWWETAEWVDAFAPEKGVKCYLVQDHEVFVAGKYERVERTYRLPLHKLVVSRWLQDVMAILYHDENCTLVGNAVDSEHFNSPLRSKNSVFTVGFLYTPIARKNITLAIQAIKQARELIPELQVVAFGIYEPGVELPLPGWVQYHKNPAQNDVPKIYASCDAWLFTTISEGFGLPVLEAMACRTPVLATRAGASVEFVNAETGRLLPSSVDAFVDAILEFADMKDSEWRQLSNNAFRKARETSWEKSSGKFEETLIALVATQD